MKSKLSILLILVLALGLLLPAGVDAEFQNLPEGFVDQDVVGGIPAPTSIAWLPATEDSDMLVPSRGGQVYRHDGVSPSAGVILDLSDTICSGGEMGLLGLAVDPAFAAGQRFIYLYYTDRQGGRDCGASNRANRVSRFLMDANDQLGTEEVLIDNIPARGGNHNGGDLQFGLDGLLYISVGDSGKDLLTGDTQDDNANARLLSLLNGKILRVTPEGDVPASNPFTGSGTISCADTGGASIGTSSVKAEKKNRKAKKKKRKKREKRQLKKKRRQLRRAPACQEIFATGLRNPYRIAFDPDDGSGSQRFYINDVGGSAWEEISEGIAGADYGWNVREGPCKTDSTNQCGQDTRFQEPLFAYAHSTGCRTITGGAFVPDGSGWPATYLDTYLYADFICDTIFVLRDEEPGEAPDEFGSGTGATHLAFGPDYAMYYTTFDDGGQVRRIVFGP